jgi:hypothetical protein
MAYEATRKHGFVEAGGSTGKQLFHNTMTLRGTGVFNSRGRR